jgi:hypothetical protein
MAIQRTFPRKSLEQGLRVPRVLKDYNGGNPWAPLQVANALNIGPRSSNFYYLTAASRDHGLTTGSRETAQIALTDLGRRAVYPESDVDEQAALMEAFLNVDVYRRVLEHYGGNRLPERKFLENTLHQIFGIDPSLHDEFLDLFNKNTRYVGIGAEFTGIPQAAALPTPSPTGAPQADGAGAVTVAAPEDQDQAEAPVCFVIMPFTERDEQHEPGFFAEVLAKIFTPAAVKAGFTVKTAQRRGSDVIQHTIVNDLLAADLVLADLTEHNPNVLFELGMRMKEDKPVALVRAKGTGPIFDVDYMLRVEEYNPNVWPSTVERDVPRISDHIKATWDNRETALTFMKILHREDGAA